jgi:hypothetical protein
LIKWLSASWTISVRLGREILVYGLRQVSKLVRFLSLTRQIIGFSRGGSIFEFRLNWRLFMLISTRAFIVFTKLVLDSWHFGSFVRLTLVSCLFISSVTFLLRLWLH